MPADFITESPRAHPLRGVSQFAAVLCVAVVAELAPWPVAALSLKPDFPALALVYWAIYTPRIGGFFAAFAVGLLMDLARHTPLGFTPLCYVVMMALVEWLRGRFALLGPFGRGFHVFLILAAAQLASFGISVLNNPEASLSWRHFLPSVSGGFLWLALPLAARQLRRRRGGGAIHP